MLINNRIIFKIAGVITDESISLSKIYSGTATKTIGLTTDYLYIGGDMPFNHRYFHFDTPQSDPISVAVELWTGNTWVAAIDVVDETEVAGASFAQSGIISWRPDEDQSSWNWDDTDDMAASGLETLNIKRLYWARLSFSDAFSGAVVIKYVGHKFCEEEDLAGEYPEFSDSNLKTAFKAGKTTWDDQILSASEYLLSDLRINNVIGSRNQILDWRIFQKAAIHKTAEIIFRAFGDDYKDNMIEAKKAYKEYLNIRQFDVDLNKNATLDDDEIEPLSAYLRR